MIQKNDHTISPMQAAFFIIQTQVGVGFISLPFSVHDAGAKSDGWISVLLAGFLIQIIIFIFTYVNKKFPKQSFYDVLYLVFGKFVGKLVTIAYIIYFVFVGCQVFIYFSYIIELWTFPKTPNWVLVTLLGLITFYLIIDNLRIIARYHTFISVLLVGIILLSLPTYMNTEIRYILPIGNNGLFNILMSSKEALLSFLGFELILFIYPFVEGGHREKVIAFSGANIFITLYYTYLTFLTMIFFSPEEFPLVPQPLLYILKAFTFPIIERVDLLFLTNWIVFVSTTLISYMYIASIGLARVLTIKNHTKVVPIILGCSIVFSLIPKNVHSIDRWSMIINQFGYIFLFVIPLVTMVVILIFKRQKVSV